MARPRPLLALAACLALPALMGAKVPPAGDDYHVPLFVKDRGEFWETRVLGEVGVARNSSADAAALVSTTLGRCPDVSTLVVEPEPDTPWWRTAELLIGLQGTKRTVALRGETTELGLTGSGLVESQAKLPRAAQTAAVIALTGGLLQVDGRTVCDLQPNTPICEGNLAGLRASLGGQAVIVHAAPGVPTGLVMKLGETLSDHGVLYGVTGKKGELRTFAVTLLQGRIPWVQQACDQPLSGP